MIIYIFFLFLLLFLVIKIFLSIRNVYRRKNKNKNDFLLNFNNVKSFLDKIYSFDDYITWVERDKIKVLFSSTSIFFNGKLNLYKRQDNIKLFLEIYNDFDNYIINYNKTYIKKHKMLLKGFFKNIEGKELDSQQQDAIITDEYSNLIIAGAGSGKTLTILGKVKYLINYKKINPKDILLLSFTKKTVDELNNRLMEMKLDARASTFHQLGYDTIKKAGNKTPSVANENTLNLTIKKFLKNEITNYPEALDAYIQYVSCYSTIPKENDSYKSLGEKIEHEKGVNLYTLKSKCEKKFLNKVESQSLDTIKGEKVKSVEELIIANFLYINGVNYEYEKQYPFSNYVYNPDFYLSDYDVYLEHFGVDENNKAKWLTLDNEKKYVEEMFLKRETHLKNKTKLIETFSFYNRDNILLDKLSEKLKNENIILKPKKLKDIYKKLSENEDNFGNELTKLIATFITLSKSQKLDENSLKQFIFKKLKSENDFIKKRTDYFLKFVIEILKKYNSNLKNKNEIDFNDMINLSTELVKARKVDYKFKYIIVDEFQDISYSRFNLIKEIRNLSAGKLICVGDDWQSIYRFAGSVISLFTEFEKHLGKSEILLIEQTYRNTQSLIDITSKFIFKNKKQREKAPKSKKKNIPNPVELVYYYPENAEDVLINEIEKLTQKSKNQSIMILGRYNHDINEFIKLTPKSRIKYYERSSKLLIRGFENTDIIFQSIHKSKGLEAENVIILNLKNDLLGFPNKIMDDPLLSLLLSDKEGFSYAEERRLFYVALTRTKNKVILLIPNDQSIFISELIEDNELLFQSDNVNISCPYCKKGNIIVRLNKKNNSNFLGCSNYPICNQTFKNLDILEKTKLCSMCRSGFLVQKSSAYGEFLGCTNYPRCKKTISI